MFVLFGFVGLTTFSTASNFDLTSEIKCISNISSLNDSLDGYIVTTSSNTWKNDKIIYNPFLDDINPSAIIYTKSTLDAQNSINYVRHNNLKLRVRSGGHIAGGFTTVEHGIVIDVSNIIYITRY